MERSGEREATESEREIARVRDSNRARVSVELGEGKSSSFATLTGVHQWQILTFTITSHGKHDSVLMSGGKAM
jgi:hypothetical protein